MQILLVVVQVGLSLGELAGCRIPLDHIPPKIEPVSQVGGLSSGLLMELTASANCVEIGATVTFTARIKNTSVEPITINGAPVVDIIIMPGSWRSPPPIPTLRWSESPQYPPSINPVLPPGEERTYHWNWVADTTFAGKETHNVGVSFTATDMQTPSYSSPSADTGVLIGVGRLSQGDDFGFSCSEMRLQAND